MPKIKPKSSKSSNSPPVSLRGFHALSDLRTLQPVWVRVNTASHVTGLSKTRVFEEAIKGSFISKILKHPDKERGIRLINYASLMEFIERVGE
jgi:hypothetical protein